MTELAAVNPGSIFAKEFDATRIPDETRGTSKRVRLLRKNGDIVGSLVEMQRLADLDDMVGPEVGTRLLLELRAAMRRRPVPELHFSGLLRVLLAYSERLREAAAESLDILVRRNALERPLYGALLRGLVEANDSRIHGSLARALSLEDGGGLVTLTAAALSDDVAASTPLAHLATSRSPHLAFAAELARVARAESDGKLLFLLAPRIKESFRIDLTSQLLLPLLRRRRRVTAATAALNILRDSERHLGRWLCIAELVQLSGCESGRTQSAQLATVGPASARSAWGFVGWALDPNMQAECRPTLELLARLSDRPSAERDLSFLFRMGEARLPTAQPMLESLVKSQTLSNALRVRAIRVLIRHYGREDLLQRLLDVARSPSREPLGGLALAAIVDCHGPPLTEITGDCLKSRNHSDLGFSLLVRMGSLQKRASPILTEENYRHLQCGWLD